MHIFFLLERSWGDTSIGLNVDYQYVPNEHSTHMFSMAFKIIQTIQYARMCTNRMNEIKIVRIRSRKWLEYATRISLQLPLLCHGTLIIWNGEGSALTTPVNKYIEHIFNAFKQKPYGILSIEWNSTKWWMTQLYFLRTNQLEY